MTALTTTLTAALSARTILIGWLLLPFLTAFLAAVLPPLARWLALLCCLATGAVAAAIQLGGLPPAFDLLGDYGVALQPDAFAAPFLLLNALVCGAVVLDSWRRPMPGPFLLLMVLHGGLSSAFVVVDLISLYVTLEVVGISAFLLILSSRSERSMWVALRYLLIGNSVMTLFLIGAALVYLEQGSFRFEEVAGTSSIAALALLLVGLLTKSGLFLSGLWLPLTHAEAPAEVSALLSGVVVCAGIAPLLRLTSTVPALGEVITIIGLASTVLGLLFALADTDAKRLLAWSTLSQMGLVALAPVAGGIYALAHGLAKAALFLVARRFPSRALQGWATRPLPAGVWWPLWIGSFSIVGVPPLAGYAAKSSLDGALHGPLALAVTLLSVGTAAVYGRLWGAPLSREPQLELASDPGTDPSWSPGVLLLLLALVVLGVVALPWGPALASATATAALVLLGGWGLHRLLEWLRLRERWRLPELERLSDLLGGIGVVGAGLLVILNR
ncbi:proton-conducting membrane transporter [Synechococcus sp. J7-Johnson]|uniref:proton-conducting transporter transmembrane domain-containing protein n=1 Tax=Synechococcus sp. J7-Johnson TaxID=2823737 RepID=UPI0020CBE847|nr:proton-conducting transporter membrane subunit [Synechococcus sp. J7-Johnson]MCP9841837.1 proton-conducting membrane transporter [Synechococcus sp. J7-Johnson]